MDRGFMNWYFLFFWRILILRFDFMFFLNIFFCRVLIFCFLKFWYSFVRFSDYFWRRIWSLMLFLSYMYGNWVLLFFLDGFYLKFVFCVLFLFFGLSFGNLVLEWVFVLLNIFLCLVEEKCVEIWMYDDFE